MLVLTGTIEGGKEMSRRFVKMPDNISNWKAPLFRSGREVMVSIEGNYASRGAVFGERWAPRKDNNPWPILEKTGRMRRAFHPRMGPDYVEITNSAEQFRYHQSAAPRKKLPRRVMMKLDEIRRRFIVREFQRHIRQAWKDTQ